MDLSIIIVNHNHGSFLNGNISSIYNNTSKLDFEIILINNTPNDSYIPNILKLFPKIKYHENTFFKGFSENNNIGIEMSYGERLLFLNPDTELKNDAINKLYNFVINNEVGVCGAKLINRDNSVQMSCRKFPTILSSILRRTPVRLFFSKHDRGESHLMNSWDHNCTRQVDWVLGACMMIDKSLINKIGLFDINYFMYCEDIDLCYRSNKMGYMTYYLHDAEIYHDHQGGSDKNLISKYSYFHIKSMIYFIYKHKYFKMY